MNNTIKKLTYVSEEFPKEALEEAIANKEETTEILLHELDELIEAEGETDIAYYLHIYAIYLFAQFREKRAFPRIIALISYPPEKVDELFGDIVTEDLHNILYSTFNGDFDLLKNVIENPELNMFVRDAALTAYYQLSLDNGADKQELIDYLRWLLFDNPADQETEMTELIQAMIADNHLFEMINDVQRLYDEGKIGLLGNIRTSMYGEFDSFIDYMYRFDDDKKNVDYIDNAIEKLKGWTTSGSSEEYDFDRDEIYKSVELKFKEQYELDQQSVEKVGRNDPCPCGSGKKYKKCCMKKDRAFEQKGQESVAIQTKRLEDYPSIDKEESENNVLLTNHFDDEAIEIDRLAYLAQHFNPDFNHIDLDTDKVERAKISYLAEAFELFKEKCNKEGIQKFSDYDEQYKIHYRSEDWVNKLVNLISQRDYSEGNEDLLDQLHDTIKTYS